MNTRLLTCLVLLLALPCLAPTRVMRGNARAVPVVTSGATYLVKQDFEGTGYDNSETWSEAGTGTVDEDYTSVVLAGSQSLRIVTSGTVGRTTSPTFTAQADVWVYCLFRPVSIPATQRWVFQLRDASSALCSLRFNSSGTLTIRAGSAGGTATVTALSAGTTYHIWMHYIKGSGSDATGTVGFSTSGTKPTSGNEFASHTAGNATTDADRLELGDAAGASSGTIEYLYDKVRVDDASIGDSPL